MGFSIFPKETKFFELFKEQGKLLLEASDVLKELFEDLKNIDIKVNKITKIEEKGDELFKHITVELHETFVPPIDPEDIHLLSTYLEELLDYYKDLAFRFKIYKIDVITPVSQNLLDIIYECAKLVMGGISHISNFEDITELRKEIMSLEKKGDDIYRNGISLLFEEIECGRSTDVANLLTWKEIYENMDHIIDRTEDVFSILEIILIKHA